MTLCVGWLGPCEVYGDYHGCARPDGHSGLHICACRQDSRGRIVRRMPRNRRSEERR